MTTIDVTQYRQAAAAIRSVLRDGGPLSPTRLLEEAGRRDGGPMQLLRATFQIMLGRGEVRLDHDLLADLPRPVVSA